MLDLPILICKADGERLIQTIDILTDIMSMCIVHVHNRTSASATEVAGENGTMLINNYTVVIALPLNLSYTVRLAPKQKLGVAAIFSLGIIIILVAMARAIQISRKAFADGVLLALWGIIESTVRECQRTFETTRCYSGSMLGSTVSDTDLWLNFFKFSCHSRMPLPHSSRFSKVVDPSDATAPQRTTIPCHWA